MSTVIIGYLGSPYMEVAYAGGYVQENLAAQALIDISNSTDLAAQVLATITTQQHLASESNAIITTAGILAAQSLVTRIESEHLGAESLSTITTQQSLAAQSNIIRTESENLAAQSFISRREAELLPAQANIEVTGVTNSLGAEAGIASHLHITCDVYLADPYLSGPYLKSCQQVMLPAQAVIIRRESETIAAQSLVTIIESEHLASQANAIITTNKHLAAQANLKQIERLAAQARVVLYNTTNLRILSEFSSRGTTGINWTANSTEPGDFDVNNLNTDIVEQVWRTATGNINSITLVCDTEVAQGVFVDTLAILNHNLSGAATVFFDGSNDPGFATVETVQVDLETRNAYWIAPSIPLTSYRYWRLRINDPGSADNFIRIGTIVFGSAIIFSGECYTDNVRLGRQQFVDQVFTEGFTNVKNDRGQKKNLGLEFRNLNYNRGNYRNLREVIETQSTILKCLWIPTPRYPSRFALFGKLTELPTETHNDRGDQHDYIDLSISVDEAE